MQYFYATKTDKNGNKLTTSYDTKVKADKYGGTKADGVQRWTGVRYLQSDGSYGDPSDGVSNEIIRSRLTREGPAKESTGNYQLYAFIDDGYKPTPHRFETYGLANNAMKSLVDMYGDMLVIELVSQTHEPDEDENENAPF